MAAQPLRPTREATRMKHYLISFYQPDGPPLPPERLGPVMREIDAIKRELESAGSWVFGGGLHEASTASVVHVRNGELLITDGPFIEGKEHLGGLTVIAVPDLDSALEWGQRYARATGLPIEVRPFHGEAQG